MADSQNISSVPDQLPKSVEYGTINDTEVVTEPLASRGTSTKVSAEATVEFADQNTMQGPIPDQQHLAHTKNQQLLEAAKTPLPASPKAANISAPSKSSDSGPSSSARPCHRIQMGSVKTRSNSCVECSTQ